MDEKNYINYHILISHSPSNLNRDDMNMQKTAVFGGVKRTRISSQSLKRAMRYSDYYKENIGEPSKRTRQLGKLTTKYVEALKDRYEEDLIKSVMSLISGESDIKADTQSSAVSAWAVSEVEQYCQLYKKLKEQFPETKEFKKEWNKATDKKKLVDGKTKVELFREALKDGQDIALSGRMATSGIMTNVDASFAVAHALTTHAVDTDIDWFSAVDDLNPETGDTGSAHLNTNEFSSGVFYRYASLNLKQLQDNLGIDDRKQVLQIAAHVLHMLATVVPSGKQNSYAAFNLADFALVSFSDQPISLANAFENPVKAKKEGLMKPSIEALLNYHKSISSAYGIQNDKQSFFSTIDCKLKHKKEEPEKETEIPKISELSVLEEWLRNDAN